MNLCIFGEPGFGKTTLVEALTRVTEERLFGNGVDYTFREMNDPDEADLLTQADVAVLVSNTEGGLTDQSDELLSLAEELNVAHLAVFINKSDLIDTISETMDMLQMEAFEKLDEYGFEDSGFVVYGSATGALEDPNGEWGDKIIELLTMIENTWGVY